jgi:WbqC-like protein family
MPKSVAIIQSNYIPWKGYFDMIGMVDEFIIYDEVQYTKNDWRNRNRIKTQSGTQWITIPVYQKSLNQKISESQISDAKWANKHWNTLVTNYSKAAHFKSFSPFLEEFYKRDQPDLLSEVNTTLIKLICDYLDIKTKIRHSTDYLLKGDPTEKLVSLCTQIGATTYLTGPAAKNYLQENLFNQEGISVEWMDYSNYPEYAQLHPPFEHAVSILDLLFHTGKEASKYMKFSKK